MPQQVLRSIESIVHDRETHADVLNGFSTMLMLPAYQKGVRST